MAKSTRGELEEDITKKKYEKTTRDLASLFQFFFALLAW